tara:strand:+ start:281 stop:478 length:198 start_codon:yes stop_codon:yes gene_type:complete
MNYELRHRLDKKGNQIILESVKNIIPKGVNISSIRQPNALIVKIKKGFIGANVMLGMRDLKYQII